ncbi:MAG TPA: hypothetical protein P5179_02945 [Candidatus Latescibacteria bacterium]|nr:hypothetical protein [Candidatus Latescibacterota bacterium]HQK21491.1 hypothetical protein [Candidatus Latescibacterota bacterium]HRS94209.1 hypothetical protein [Candidatus Latescibacterota bacterium]HRU23710.1 hypothetical protein [Candidatus Latescibacterota bacterium]
MSRALSDGAGEPQAGRGSKGRKDELSPLNPPAQVRSRVTQFRQVS